MSSFPHSGQKFTLEVNLNPQYSHIYKVMSDFSSSLSEIDVVGCDSPFIN